MKKTKQELKELKNTILEDMDSTEQVTNMFQIDLLK